MIERRVREDGERVDVAPVEGRVLGNLVGDDIGRAGWGVRIGHGGTYDFFRRSQILVVSEYPEKIRSDRIKVNAPWSISRQVG
jgi:hypothetical protein